MLMKLTIGVYKGDLLQRQRKDGSGRVGVYWLSKNKELAFTTSVNERGEEAG